MVLKTKYKTNISKDKLKNLIHISRTLNDILNMPSRKNAPYVGDHAFSHKGGLHASAIEKNSSTYEHIKPEIVGNSRITNNFWFNMFISWRIFFYCRCM